MFDAIHLYIILSKEEISGIAECYPREIIRGYSLEKNFFAINNVNATLLRL
jgi:hypothetical protein